MAKPLISKVLKDAGKLKSRDDRIAYLRKYRHPALTDVLRINFDADIAVSYTHLTLPTKA